jgi:glycosyltransferase involved in cell wall biosynthesis
LGANKQNYKKLNISVIIPVFNASCFLDKSIGSALSQSETAEVILVDDRSTDDSLEICKRWEGIDSRVKVFENEGTKGAGAARNVGLGHARCEYVAFLDADDYYLEGRFEEDEVLFNNYQNLSATANKVEIKTTEGKVIIGLNAIFKNNDSIAFQKSNAEVNIYDFFKGSALHLNGLTYKSNTNLRFDENLKQSEDIDFIVRLLLTSTIMSTSVDKTKAVYLIHESNTISHIAEATYFRRTFAKKHYALANDHKLKLKVKWKLFKDFMEYDYLWYFGKNHSLKKLYKLLLLPFFFYRIGSKTDPVYDKDRKILLS